MRDPFQYFRVEAHELLEKMESGVASFQSGPIDQDVLLAVLRHAHTFKGAARVVSQGELAEHAHSIEDVLEPYRGASRPMLPHDFGALFDLFAQMRAQLTALGSPSARPVDAPAGPVPEPLRLVHADVSAMDDLLDEIAEAGYHLGALEGGARRIERASALAELLVSQLQRQALAPDSPLHATAEEIRTLCQSVTRGIGRDLWRFERELGQMRESAERLRLVEARSLVVQLERTIGDVSSAERKDVEFSAVGGGIRLDAHVLEAVQPALLQAVRNAVAHGIEVVQERLLRGKEERGRVEIEISVRQGKVVFVCRDDGRGIDLEAVRKTCQEKGLIAAHPDSMSKQELLAVLLSAGISTSGKITGVAGRGLGMSVIRTAAETLGGTVRIESEPGEGTSIELCIPLFLAAVDVLVVEAGGEQAGIPLDAVQGCVRFSYDELVQTAAGVGLLYQGALLPFIPLERLLGEGAGPLPGAAAERRTATAAVLKSPSGFAAAAIDKLIGIRNWILRPLPPIAASSITLGAASLDSHGDPQLVLDADALVCAARGQPAESAPEMPERAPILVVDDSLTTRMLEQRILEAAGYRVALAASAEEALEMAYLGNYSLFLVDVEMPGMDGFSFIEHTRRSPVLRNIPAVLVTSRSSPEDKRRGEEVGAAGYIVKGDFNQQRLLELIQTLVP